MPLQIKGSEMQRSYATHACTKSEVAEPIASQKDGKLLVFSRPEAEGIPGHGARPVVEGDDASSQAHSIQPNS